jgi:hypothetical protein
MQSILWFFWGDLLANFVVGAAAAAAGCSLATSALPMWLVPPLALLTGALSGLLINMVFFSRWLGAMETMFSTLLSGMVAGLMGALLSSFGMGGVAMAGAGVGLAVFAALALLQAHIVAQARRGIWS